MSRDRESYDWHKKFENLNIHSRQIRRTPEVTPLLEALRYNEGIDN